MRSTRVIREISGKDMARVIAFSLAKAHVYHPVVPTPNTADHVKVELVKVAASGVLGIQDMFFSERFRDCYQWGQRFHYVAKNESHFLHCLAEYMEKTTDTVFLVSKYVHLVGEARMITPRCKIRNYVNHSEVLKNILNYLCVPGEYAWGI